MMRQSQIPEAQSQPATAPPLRRPGGVLATIDKTWSVLRITLASRLAYVGELLVRSIFMVLILFIFAQLWQATGQVERTGFSLAQLIWYLAFTEAIMTSVQTGAGEVDREVRSGDLAYRLARPLPYPLYHFGAALGERLLRFGLNLLVGVVVALLVVGPIQIGPLALMLSLAAALLSFVADWVWSMAISLLSFWFEDTFGLHLLYRRALMLLGGMLIPLEAYPAWLGDLARALPFQYLVYAPARLFVRPDLVYFGEVAGVLGLLALVGCLPMLLIYHLGLRQVSAQGG
jgi:ABC-2 type transport system permease protein